VTEEISRLDRGNIKLVISKFPELFALVTPRRGAVGSDGVIRRTLTWAFPCQTRSQVSKRKNTFVFALSKKERFGLPAFDNVRSWARFRKL